GEDRREEEGSCEAQGSCEEEEVSSSRGGTLRDGWRLHVQSGDFRCRFARCKIAARSPEAAAGSTTKGVGETEARSSRTSHDSWMGSGYKVRKFRNLLSAEQSLKALRHISPTPRVFFRRVVVGSSSRLMSCVLPCEDQRCRRPFVPRGAPRTRLRFPPPVRFRYMCLPVRPVSGIRLLWSCGRVAEGGRLLNRYTLSRPIHASNPSL